MILLDARSPPHGLARLPKKVGRVAQQLAARGKDWIVTHSIGNDTGSTPARSGDEVALIRDTIKHYGPVFIAPLSIQIRRAGVQKKFGGPPTRASGAVRLAREDDIADCIEGADSFLQDEADPVGLDPVGNSAAVRRVRSCPSAPSRDCHPRRICAAEVIAEDPPREHKRRRFPSKPQATWGCRMRLLNRREFNGLCVALSSFVTASGAWARDVATGVASTDGRTVGGMSVLPFRLTRCILAQAGHRSEMYTLSSGTSSANQTCTFWPVVAQR